MQEEVENRTVNLAISTTKLTARNIMSGIRMYLRHREKVKNKKAVAKNEKPQGKQSVKELIGQNQGVTNIEVANTELRDFEKVTKKYGIDFAIKKDKSVSPPRYLVFFKARDADAMTAAYKEYTNNVMLKKSRPSVLKHLGKLKDLVASIPRKVREKKQEREL